MSKYSGVGKWRSNMWSLGFYQQLERTILSRKCWTANCRSRNAPGYCECQGERTE